MGQKVGLSAICQDLGVTHPPTVIVRDRSDLSIELGARNRPVMIKGNSSTGGRQVRQLDPLTPLDQVDMNEQWFPLVVQDLIEGDMVSVEALFVHGNLRGWLYSVATEFASQFGQSTRRQFGSPPTEEVLNSLGTIGQAAGLHGFANCSFLLEKSTGKHFLFELDMRPNRWHQFGPSLGMDWARLMRMEPGKDSLSSSGVDERFTSGASVVYLFPRHLQTAIGARALSDLMRWLRREPGTWDMRQRTDKLINRAEWRAVISTLLRTLGLGWLLSKR